MISKPLLLPSERSSGPARQRRHREGGTAGSAHSTSYLRMPAQRPAEVLGTLTHAQLYVLHPQLTLCTFLIGIGSGQRQLIAVTCIAEHA